MLRFDAMTVRQGSFKLEADFDVRPAAITAVLGPSGSGKSTLLAATAGFLPLSAGEIWLDDRRLSPLSPGDRPLSILFQDGNLFPHLDVATNVAVGLEPSGRLDRAECEAVAEALARVGLAGLEARKPAELSGGQQSRAALARALLRKRPVVLLDEPFAALGPGLRREMLDLVKEVFRDETVLLVTHAPDEARAVAAETVFVDNGRAMAPRATVELLNDPPPALRQYMGE